MWKKIAVAGAVAAAALGTGTAALAVSGGSSTTPGTPPTSTAASSATAGGGGQGAKKGQSVVGRALHAQFVTRKGKSNTFITHDEIRGAVTAVSGSSITVKAADNFTQTYVVNSSTKVRLRTAGKGAASSISAVHSGDTVEVLGTGTGPFTASGVVDVKK